MYFYIKALHIIFVVTWFAGLFYMVRLFIYNREAQDKSDVEKKILQKQFAIMIQRLWFGITWPSCILTVIFGTWMSLLYGSLPLWLMIKIGFVIGLLLYHFSLQIIYKQQKMGVFKYTSNQLRIWNEGATVFLIAIVMLVSVKTNLSFVWGILGLAAFTGILLAGIKIYRKYRKG
jgi:protoporphyrinogen IX oxidase